MTKNIVLETLNGKRAEILREIKMLRGALGQINDAISKLQDESDSSVIELPKQQILYYENKSIKEMVLEVLKEANEPQTANQIIQLISNKFSKKIDRTSLSPQLSRLGHSRILQNNEGRWFFFDEKDSGIFRGALDDWI